MDKYIFHKIIIFEFYFLVPICFSIKKPKDQESLEIRSALPYEESEREDGEASGEDVERNPDRNEEMNERSTSPAEEPPHESPPKIEEPPPPKKPTDMTLEKWGMFINN